MQNAWPAPTAMPVLPAGPREPASVQGVTCTATPPSRVRSPVSLRLPGRVLRGSFPGRQSWGLGPPHGPGQLCCMDSGLSEGSDPLGQTGARAASLPHRDGFAPKWESFPGLQSRCFRPPHPSQSSRCPRVSTGHSASRVTLELRSLG